MKKFRIARHYLLLAALVGVGLPLSGVFAQAPGSTATYSGTVTITSLQTDISESLYLGPGLYTIDGTWEIYSKNVWIDPTATLTGTGKLIFYNPQEAGGAASPTMLDGNNGNFMDVNVDMNNLQSMVLTDIPDPGFGSINPGGALAAALKIGKAFNLVSDNGQAAFDGGDVVLNGNDFVFDADATITGYRPNRYVQTSNSIMGHMVKQFGATSSAFTFPVGFENSFTYNPVQITASEGTFHVSVQDHTASLSDESGLAQGTNRTWHIYADAPTQATIDIQHDTGTEYGSFNNQSPHFITRWKGSVNWEYNTSDVGAPGTLTTGPSPTPSSSLRSLTTTVVGSATDPLSYYTKTFFQVPDLLPVLYARPSTQYSTTPFSVVVDVIELNSVATTGLITVKITKDLMINLTFNSGTSSVGGRSVQNNVWNFDASNPTYYVLTTTQAVAAGDKLSFGLDGLLTPNATAGVVTISSVILGGSGGEAKITNNIDADKIDYFPQ
ncbi:hypothetical protein [Spirosoma validum]|uniref:Uncharacterized protein n=1 Tax=Spirosoma validum TaxID=2771355 RepID=A0A927B268_9BACT|nr:hypothetical protein [Spirosoma validum]MBD2754035.1 hypothetical protein [Spirosoma validum]